MRSIKEENHGGKVACGGGEGGKGAQLVSEIVSEIVNIASSGGEESVGDTINKISHLVFINPRDI